MKKFSMCVLLLTLMAVVAMANDANQMHYVQIFTNRAATLEKTDVTLLVPGSSVTDGLGTTGGVTDVSSYEGYALLILGQGAATVASSHTSVVKVCYGYTATPVTPLISATQTSATAKFTSYEFDFDTLQGTNASLYLQATLTNVTGSSTGMIGNCVLVYDAARVGGVSTTGEAIDISAYKGNASLIADFGPAVNESAAYTNTVTYQTCTNTAGNWETITNLAGTAGVEYGTSGGVDTFPIDLARCHKFIRATSVATNDVGSVGVILVAPMKSE